MANMTFQSKPLSRSAGRSPIAAAAYRAAVRLTDERQQLTRDYRRKGPGVVSADIITPAELDVDRGDLWNAADRAEKRKDARTAREWILALPHELDEAGRGKLARDFGQRLVDRYGIAVDVCVHRPDTGGDARNHHAHILATTRRFDRGPDGRVTLGEKATIELSNTKRKTRGLGPVADEVKDLRHEWAAMTNDALARANKRARVDPRSLKDQRLLDQQPTVHLGHVASALERRGIATERGNHNRLVERDNRHRMDRVKAAVFDLADLANLRKEAVELMSFLENGRGRLKDLGDRLALRGRQIQKSVDDRTKRWQEKLNQARDEQSRVYIGRGKLIYFSERLAHQGQAIELERQRQAQIEAQREREAQKAAADRDRIAAEEAEAKKLARLERERHAAAEEARERQIMKAAREDADRRLAEACAAQDRAVEKRLEAAPKLVTKTRPQAEPTRSAPKAQPAKPAPAQPAPAPEPEKPKPLTPAQLAALHAQQQGWGR